MCSGISVFTISSMRSLELDFYLSLKKFRLHTLFIFKPDDMLFPFIIRVIKIWSLCCVVVFHFCPLKWKNNFNSGSDP